MTQTALEQALNGGGTVTFATNGTIVLTNPITISHPTTIDARGLDVTISGSSTTSVFVVETKRLFKVETNTVFSLIGLKLVGGRVVGATDEDAIGGGILNEGGMVSLTDCALSGHYVWGGEGSNAGRGAGAAIYSTHGSVNLTNSTISGCGARGGRGTQLGFAGRGLGGALYLDGAAAILHHATISGNYAYGGYPPDKYGISFAGEAAGGAVYATNSTIIVNDSMFSGNSADGMIGDATWPGTGRGGALHLETGTDATISFSSFNGNQARGTPDADGWANAAGLGGAVFNAGELRILGCMFDNCQAIGYGAAGQGGAVWSSSTATVIGSTFVNNRAWGVPGQGGAVWSSGAFTATNSTWATNIAASLAGAGGAGGALFIAGGVVALEHVTTSGNSVGPGAGPQGSAIAVEAGGSGVIRNSIIANSSHTLVWGAVTDGGYNICSDNSAGFTGPGSLNNTDPLLLPLADNGGSTRTMALQIASPCVNAIPAGFAPVDQRGIARPQGEGGDIGAVEIELSGTPVIQVQPSPATIPPSGSASFSVTAIGTPPISYQWWHDANAVPGATQPAYTIETALAGAQGGYFVVLSNVVGVVTSTVATLNFDASALAILTQPESRNVAEGQAVTFDVLVSGIAPFAYQWLRDGVAIASATSSSFRLADPKIGDSGHYSVLVTNAWRAMTSSPATLVVTSSVPVIVSEPSSVVVSPGGAAAFSVEAAGPLLTYQWWHNGSAISGATGSIYDIPKAMAGAQGAYSVVISNYAGSVTSTVATLEFDASALNIITQPQSLVVAPGASANFNVLVSGIPAINYQWFHNGVAIPGAVGSSHTIPSVQSADGGSYSVVVRNDYKELTSATAILARGTANPPLLSLSKGTTNLFITYAGEAAGTYRLLVSEDLGSWTGVATNLPTTSGAQQFVIPIGPDRAFFRVISP